VRRHPDLAADHKALWAEQAATLDAEGFRLMARHWLASADDASNTEPAGPKDEVSRLHMSRTLDGWLRLDGLFTPQDADLLDAALDGGVDRALRAARDGDPSVEALPVSALRAGALVDLAAQAMRHEPSEASVPDRYRVAVVVRAGEATEPADAACDAAAYRVALSTDIHHCTPRSEGGATSVDNGILLCRRHHSFVHRQRWNITIENGKPTFRQPDGTTHTVKRWSPAARAS
jgi:hypothetical protein